MKIDQVEIRNSLKTNRNHKNFISSCDSSLHHNEARFTEFPALSVDRRVGISRSVSDTDDRF